MFLTLIVAAMGLVSAVLYFSGRYAQSGQLQKVSEEILLYDYWAVMPGDSERLFSENFAPLYYDGEDSEFFTDYRVAPYAVKLLQVAEQSGFPLTIASSYNMGLILDLKGENSDKTRQWLVHNAWRLGFVLQDGNDVRYVGVFPAEQMYYSGMSLDEYCQSFGA